MSQWLRQSTAQTVQLGPFLDKTDGVTEETGLTPASEISKNGGAFAAGPTGTHDAEGWYTFSLTTTQTNTLGILKMKAHDAATHLPAWDTFMVLPADVYDSLVLGTDTLPADVTQWLGTAVSATVAGVPEVDVTHVSGDATAADNLELQYDTAGLAGDTFPATQLQVSAIANTGSAVNTSAESSTLTVGTESSGTFSDTGPLDGVRHEHTATAGAMDLFYEFDIGGDGIPTSTTLTGRLNGANDDLEVLAFNWGASDWDRIGTLNGTNSSSDSVETFTLFTSHVGTGVNLGKVRIRFFDGEFTLTSATLRIDQLFVSFSVARRTVGYADGAIWIDTNGSNTDTESFVDGVADNPVSTLAAALTLSSNLNLKRFRIVNGSTITLTGNSDNFTMLGSGWSLDLNGQSIVGISVEGADVSGTAAGVGTSQTFDKCFMSATTHIKGTHILESGLRGTQTVGQAGDYFFDRCHSAVAGTSTPIFNFGVAVGDMNLNVRNYSGGIQLEAMGDTGTDTASIEGRGQIIEGTCTGGTVAVRGLFTTSGITNLTLADNARFDIDQVREAPQKNAAFSDLEFLMVDAANGKTPETGLTVTGERSLNGAAFVAVSGAIAEVGNGIYQFDALAADMNADVVTFRFSAAGALDTFVTIKTTP